MRLVNDPRPALRAADQPFIYAILHAHILYLFIGYQRSDIGTTIVVSNSYRGEILIPILRAHGLVPVRGAGRYLGRDRGDGSVLAELTLQMKSGRVPLLAVDGPRGPRGDVYPGVAALIQRTGAVAVCFTPVVSRRKILNRWDRLQLPLPFVRADGFFSEPLQPIPGETTEQLCQRLHEKLAAAEQKHDPVEAEAGALLAEQQREALRARNPSWPEGPFTDR